MVYVQLHDNLSVNALRSWQGRIPRGDGGEQRDRDDNTTVSLAKKIYEYLDGMN